MNQYKAKTLVGAQSKVRKLVKEVQEMKELLAKMDRERKLMAKLAADTPQFYNPLVVWEAKVVRDFILNLSRESMSTYGSEQG